MLSNLARSIRISQDLLDRREFLKHTLGSKYHDEIKVHVELIRQYAALRYQSYISVALHMANDCIVDDKWECVDYLLAAAVELTLKDQHNEQHRS